MIVFVLLAILTLVIWGVLYFIGLKLPESYTQQHSDIVDAPPHVIWSIMINHAKEKDWRSDLFDVERIMTKDGKMQWKEVRRDRTTSTLVTLESDAPHRLVREVVGQHNVGRKRTVEITSVQAYSRVTVTNELVLKKSFSKLGYFVSSSKNNFVQGYVNDLKQRVLHLKEED